MKKLRETVFLLCLFMPATAFCQSDFDGSWKIDLTKSSPPSKPEIWSLQNETYGCKSCVPMIRVKADATDQNVSGSPYFDAINIKIEDDHRIVETRKKGGKVVATYKTTVSSDGAAATVEFTDATYSNDQLISGKCKLQRIGKTKHRGGEHLISGSWRISKLESLSENALVFTLRVEGDTLKMSNGTGQAYAAKIDGTDAPYTGDPGITSVSVRSLSKLTVEETDNRDGKGIRVKRLMIDPANSKTLSTIVTDYITGDSELLVATKQ